MCVCVGNCMYVAFHINDSATQSPGLTQPPSLSCVILPFFPGLMGRVPTLSTFYVGYCKSQSAPSDTPPPSRLTLPDAPPIRSVPPRCQRETAAQHLPSDQ